MPSISGSDPSLMYCRAGLARAGATRFDYAQPVLSFTIGGTAVQGRLDRGTLVIEQNLGEQPDTARLDAIAALPATFVPTKGQEIVIGLGSADNRLFAGHILRTAVRLSRSSTSKVRISLDCVDYTWELGHRRVTGRTWTNTTAALIAESIVAEFAPAFSVQAPFGIQVIDFEAAHAETVPEVLSRLASAVGGQWYVDPNRRVHFFVDPETTGNAVTLANGQTDVWGLEYQVDLSQTRTRTYVLGAETATTSDVAAGDTSIPVEDVRAFNSSGGTALVGSAAITYTGLSATEGAGSLTGVPASGDGALLVDVANGAPVRVLVQDDDASAQTAMATLLGNGHDGVIEMALSGAWNDTDAQVVAAADLAAYSPAGEQRLSYETRNKFVRPGKVITSTLTTPISASGDFTIQRVRLSGFTVGHRSGAATKWPVRQVEAGTSRKEIDQVLAGMERIRTS